MQLCLNATWIKLLSKTSRCAGWPEHEWPQQRHTFHDAVGLKVVISFGKKCSAMDEK